MASCKQESRASVSLRFAAGLTCDTSGSPRSAPGLCWRSGRPRAVRHRAAASFFVQSGLVSLATKAQGWFYTRTDYLLVDMQSVLIPTRNLADESPRHSAECREGRGFSPAVEDSLWVGVLAPEGTWLQCLEAQSSGPRGAAGLKPGPSEVPSYSGDFRHQVLL